MNVCVRVEAERQALALMSHANIARVYETGVADDGRPYFAMEYVAGPGVQPDPTAGRCVRAGLRARDRRAVRKRDTLRSDPPRCGRGGPRGSLHDCASPVPGRYTRVAIPLDDPTRAFDRLREVFAAASVLELVALVCDAVHHAHERGVIHRDLKPGNVLVARTGTGETVAQPKVLDFGIARTTDTDIQLSTLQTGTGQLLGTLPYSEMTQAGAAIGIPSGVKSIRQLLDHWLPADGLADLRGWKWHLLDQFARSAEREFALGEFGRVYRLEWTTDSRRVISHGRRGGVFHTLVWNVPDGTLEREIGPHRNAWATTVDRRRLAVFSKNGGVEVRVFATCSEDGRVRVLDATPR